MTDDPSAEGTGRSDPIEPPAPEVAALRGVLTNRWNLIEFLTRRLVVPREAFTKYYPDLLELTPGSIPVVSTPMSEELVNAATGGAGDPTAQSFPVFIEFPDLPVGAPRVLRLEAARAIHFRNEQELIEHRARPYGATPEGPPLKVTPSLFTGGDQQPTQLADGPAPFDPELSTRLADLDRYTGAVALCAAISPMTERGAAAVARLIDGDNWSDSTAPWLATTRQLVLGDPVNLAGEADDVIHQVVVDRLLADESAGDPDAFLDRVREGLAGRDALDRDTEQALTHISRVLAGDVDFEGFRSEGREVLRGLFMFMLRSTPQRLLPWATSTSGAGEPAVLTAAFYCGLTIRRSGLDLEYRPEKLDVALADLEAWALDAAASRRPQPVRVAPDSSDGAAAHSLTCGDTVLSSIPSPLVPLHRVVASADSEKAEIRAACIELAREQEWGDLVESVIRTSDGYRNPPGEHLLILPGFVEVALRIDHGAFVERLTEARIGDDSPAAAALRRIIERPKPTRRPRSVKRSE
jgi:hypothetical protein